MFFNAIKELVEFVEKEEVYETQQRIMNTTMREYCKLSCGDPDHCEFIICPAERTLRYLSGAINNYLQQTHEHIKEVLGDNTHEHNTCSVCHWAGTDYFYYSTIYGLNVPVCSMCVEDKEKEEFEEQLDNNIHEHNTCSVCHWAGTDYFYYSTNYGLNVPVCSMCVEDKKKQEEEEEEEEDEYADHVFVYQEYEMEPQVCSVCNYYGCGLFNYSSDKMDEPVCDTCETKYRETANCSKRIYNDQHRPTSPQKPYEFHYYSLSNTQSCGKCPYNGAGFFATEDNKVFVCWDCGQKVCDDDDGDDSDDSEYVPSEDDDDDEDNEDFCEDPQCQETEDDDNSDDENNDNNNPEKFFGCEGCQYEWRDGWQKGWKAAMKQIKKFTKQQKRHENIHIPECAYCGNSHNLKKCAGTCEGAVRYCSLVCQKKDWKEGHKQECCSKL